MKLTHTRTLKAQEAYDPETGLIICTNCGGRRQRIVPDLNGGQMVVGIPCACGRAKREQEEQAFRQRQQMNAVMRLKAAGLQDKALYEDRFEHDNGRNPAMRYAHAYVDRWETMWERGIGLLLWGDVGTGKTFFAGCVANALLERQIPVLMTNTSRLLNDITAMRPEERNYYINSLNRYSLLILDDLGMERNTEFSLEMISSVVDSRYRSKKPMLVTTNLTLEEMKRPCDLAHDRIYSRVLERCVPICVNEHNFRKEKGAVSVSAMRSIAALQKKNSRLPKKSAVIISE